ncbi:MAG: hypothetical protein AB7O78_01610 [Thermoleophilia bacterium]
MPGIPATGGRPKTGPGHRDDAMLAFLEFEGRVNQLIRLEQQHYRERRDLLTQMKEDCRTAALSWRFGEIVDQQLAAAQEMAAGATA